MKSIEDELGLLEKWYEKAQPKFLALEEVISQVLQEPRWTCNRISFSGSRGAI